MNETVVVIGLVVPLWTLGCRRPAAAEPSLASFTEYSRAIVISGRPTRAISNINPPSAPRQCNGCVTAMLDSDFRDYAREPRPLLHLTEESSGGCKPSKPDLVR